MAGAVQGLESGYGGANADVTADAGKRYPVWVGVIDGTLTGECDCQAARRGAALCPHGVAVALAAVDAGLRWAPAPARDAERTDGKAALATLGPQEKAALLDALLRAHPELAAEAHALAVRILDPRTTGHRDHGADYGELRDEVAAGVEQALRDLDIRNMHTGRQPGYGYVSPEEAAGQMVEEAIERYRQDLRRRLKLGLHQAAQAVGAGIIAGLRACEGTYDGDEVLCYAGEDLAENYGWTVREELRKHGLQLPVQEDDDEE
ncbi:hypothetical protein [Kitasatospora sp. NPDC088346]|uniref:hypothetical protein n=1 Tax=Kitasatospora sp. NPDC088346 TaxID=3364073 RepID=UPI003820AA0E